MGLLIVIAGLAIASRLSLQTDLAELLPAHAPSVVALRALATRVGGTGNVAIAIESIDGRPEALRAYVPELAAALRTKLGDRLLSLRYRRTEIEQYYRRFAAYYASLDDLEHWADRAEHAVGARENPLYLELDDRDELAELANDVRTSRDKLEPSNAADPVSGLFMTEHGKLAVIFVRPAADSLDLAASEGLLREIERIVADTHPERAGTRIAGYTGSIPSAISEVEAVRHDLASTSILVLLCVGGVVIWYFRGLRELFMLGAPLVVGIAVALGFAEVAIGHVNAQTAFLGSVIVGTGINYGVILLDRFRQERWHGEPIDRAIVIACAGTLRATSVAAAATAIAFGTLAAGEVESFRQFGWIGGVGILACWLATFTIIPACLALLDHPPKAPRGKRPLASACHAIGRATTRAPKLVVTLTLGLAIAGAVVTVRARDHLVETDLHALATRSSSIDGIERLDNRLRAMDDRSSTPAVIATEARADTKPVCAELNRRAHTDLAGVVVRCYTVDDLFPDDLASRMPLIARLRAAVAKIDPEDVAAADRTELADLTRALDEHPPADRDLPPELAEYFVERDGSLGKLAYVDPVDEHLEPNLYRLTDALREIHLPSGKVVYSSGELVVFADVLRAVRRDSRTLTVAAAVLVLLVLVIITRRIATITRVGLALVAGVAVMLGTAVLTGQRLNFFNFVALPTTFGVGIDYAINIEERIRQRGTRDIARAVSEAGPAVLLASVTSMLGYASLLVADSRALASFGALALLGELACIVLAMTLIPALWALRDVD
ncbi:MAG: MMPL family transporter [Kofleriaceae bacterium]